MVFTNTFLRNLTDLQSSEPKYMIWCTVVCDSDPDTELTGFSLVCFMQFCSVAIELSDNRKICKENVENEPKLERIR